jgi:hypothetical protein
MVSLRLLHASGYGDGGWHKENDRCGGDDGAAFRDADRGADGHIVVVCPRINVYGRLKLLAFFDWRIGSRGRYGGVYR